MLLITIFIALICIRLFDAEAMVRRCRAHWQLDLGRMRRRGKV
jgi:membrane protein required for beta-lactamase induction